MRKFWIALTLFVICNHLANAQEENFIAIAVYNFTRYIDWPNDGNASDFLIDVIGHKSVYDKLVEITNGRKVGNRAITVRYFAASGSITPCQILFIGFWQSKDLAMLTEKLNNSHTLIITEKDGLIDSGSCINFVIRNTAIKFEIKKANIQKQGLMVSSELENIAYKTY